MCELPLCRKRVGLAAAALSCLCLSCNLLTPIIFIGEHQKKVFPEFDKLPQHRVAVVVWVPESTLFDYPHARYELATYLGEKLSYEMEQRKLGTTVVDARDVEDYLQKDLDARIDPSRVGKRFRADYVIYVEVLRFQVRDPDSPLFLKGEIEASVVVHDTRKAAPPMTKFDLTTVTSKFPPGGRMMMTATNSRQVREGLYRAFAEDIARKFYEYNVDL